MRPFVLSFATVVALAACDQAVLKTPPASAVSRDVATCAGSSAPSCRFRNSPVRVERREVRLPGRDLPFYPTAEELEFVDAKRRSWIAPPKTLTDGASIPRVFVSIVGSPTSPEFANAAAVHDAYCGVGNEDGPMFQTADWRSVHRMFYDALRVGGTPEIKAKVMFAAVYIGGPRWESVRRDNDGVARDATPGLLRLAAWSGERQQREAGATAQGNAGIAPAALRQVLRKTMRYIETNNPSLPQIEAFAEAALSRTRSQSQAPGQADAAIGSVAENDPTVGDPGTVGDPATQDPAAGDPTAGDPAAGDPAAGDPATGAATDPAIGGTPGQT